MCGLVGIYSSNMMRKHQDCFEHLLFFDTLRGRDATGIAALRKNADTDIIKSCVPGYEFLEGPRVNEHLRYTDFCWIGHNRYGTVGKNTRANAHPFDVLDHEGACILVGAHNGTLKNKHVLDNASKFGTDSEALFNHIAYNGVEQTIPLIEGAWALTWYDHYAEELRFLRNSERTLFYAWSDDKHTLIWASEQWMIRVAAGKAGLKLENDNVFAFGEDTLYSVPVPLKFNEELVMHRKGGLTGKKAPGFFHGHNQQGYREPERWAQAGGKSTDSTKTTAQAGAQETKTPLMIPMSKEEAARQALQRQREEHLQKEIKARAAESKSGQSDSSNGEQQPKKKSTTSTTQSQTQKKSEDNVTSLENARKYKGYAGVLYTKKDIEKQLSEGCSWCETETIALTERHAWIAPKKPICEKCLDGHPEKETAIELHKKTTRH